MFGNFAIGWRQVGACVLLIAACGMIAMTYSIIAVPLAEEFQPSRMVLMLTMTVMAAATAVLSPVLGNMMDKVSMRLLMATGSGLLVLGYVALSFAQSFVQVLAVFGLFMAAANILIGPMAATVLLSRWFVERRGAAMGIAVSGVALGGFIFPPLIQGLLDSFEWREALRWLALALAVITIPAILMVVERPSDKGMHPDGADSEPESSAREAAATPLSARDIFSDPTFWLFAFVLAVVLSGLKGMVTNLVPLAVDEGIAASVAALLITIYAAGGFVAKLVFAAIADSLNPRILLLVSLGGFAVAMALMAGASAGYWIIAAGVGTAAFFGGFILPLQSLLIPRIFGQKVVGKASGLLNLVMLVFLLSTPPLFGLVYDLTGNYDAVFIGLVAVAVVTAVAIVPALRLHPREYPEDKAVAAPAK